MAKKEKKVQMLSPENYIRTRARSLEIYECLINNEWAESGIANVIVTRKHTNGNFTTALYLVDLYCLGVKDSIFLFNVGEDEYHKQLNAVCAMDEFIKIDYILAHNIIFAAIEFAGDYGFSPAKTFTNITQYLLEEDKDEIELIDIECGLHGKPAYFEGPYDDKAKVNRILQQLERTAGKGNYNYTLVIGEDDDLTNEKEDEIEDSEKYDEAVRIFRMYEGKFDSLNQQQSVLFLEAVDLIFQDAVDEDLAADFYDQLIED